MKKHETSAMLLPDSHPAVRSAQDSLYWKSFEFYLRRLCFSKWDVQPAPLGVPNYPTPEAYALRIEQALNEWMDEPTREARLFAAFTATLAIHETVGSDPFRTAVWRSVESQQQSKRSLSRKKRSGGAKPCPYKAGVEKVLERLARKGIKDTDTIVSRLEALQLIEVEEDITHYLDPDMGTREKCIKTKVLKELISRGKSI